MARKKTLADYDAKLADLRKQMSNIYKERREAAAAAKGVVGETVLNLIPGVPTGKNDCKVYFENVAALIAAHRDEFNAMFSSSEAAVSAVSDEPELPAESMPDVFDEQSAADEDPKAGGI